MIEIKNLMTLERILLEIDKNKFSLGFGEAYKLHQYLINVGKITSYAFFIQDEYAQTYSDKDKLKEYHNKVMGGSVELKEEKEIIDFIEKLQEIINNEELNNLILNIKYWC